MALRLYNSLSKQKEEFKPVEPGKVRIYSCGVTVYDKCHIGHARSLYVVEVIRRYLRYRGYDVTFVRNITDVDDKIIKKANETDLSFEQVVEDNIGLYYHDLASLGIPEADHEPRATKNIGIMIAHIQGLIDKGMAYASGGDVYFRVREFGGYGKLSGQSVDQMKEAVRIDKDDKKEDPLDFVLWKASKPGEPFWNSPWGEGRPGWHIECSCMSMKHLGVETLDIHAGGRDLIFPHHENEVAQSEGLTGKPFANYWVHNGLLTIKGQKMAKSLGNFITIADMLKKYSASDIKMFFLKTHYSSPIDFSDERMYEANKTRRKIGRVIEEGLSGRSEPPTDFSALGDYPARFIDAMDDDFNTPRALGVIHELINDIHKRPGRGADDFCAVGAAFIRTVMADVFAVMDFYDAVRALADAALDAEVAVLLEDRKAARAGKDYRRSDEVRDLLLKKGIAVEDTKDGQKWRRV